MAIAAVPGYLGSDFAKASPGLRFSYFLGIWTTRDDQESALKERSQRRSYEAGQLHEELRAKGIDEVIKQQVAGNKLPGLWEKNEDAERKAWRSVLALNPNDKDAMAALVQRQNILAEPLEAAGQLLRLDAQAIAPFTTGLGNEHPLENGFAFLSPYGLPYLPGSGIKGILRQASRELANGEWGDTQGWDEAIITALFGKESGDRDTDHQRGALMFWDVIPQIKDGSLQIEVMTPHQTHYYQNGQSPHESGSPIPINFLTVPPGSRFVFHVRCDQAFLAGIAPDSNLEGRWRNLLTAAFEHAFAWIGFGAKTAVGYGQMEEDPSARELRAQEQQAALDNAAKEEALAGMSPIERSIAEAIDNKIDPGLTDGVFLSQLLDSRHWPDQDARAVATIVRDMLKAEKKWKATSKKPDRDKDYKRTQRVLKYLDGA